MALSLSADGKYLDPPGDGRPFVVALGAASRDVRRLDAHDVERLAAGGAEPGVGLYAVDSRALDELVARRGERAGDRLLRRLRRRVAPALLAAPAGPDAPFDRGRADVVLEPLAVDPAEAAVAALEAGIRAGGRPLLVEARDPRSAARCALAAFDVGAAGALVFTGDSSADERIVAELLQLEENRLSGAPLISAIVSNYNGARHLDRCLGSLRDQSHPHYEVILADDGSTDDSLAVARAYPARILELQHGGLSRARNAGIEAARGEVVAFLDADAAAEPRWLERIWRLMERLEVDGTGGPNLPFPDAGWQERVVSGAPGVALPVVRPDGNATHVTGCNMAFRRDAALAVGSFDASFLSAWDDVDFCFRLLDRGGRLVYHPTATVCHRRRASVAGYIRQQRGYARSQPPGTSEAAARERFGFRRLSRRQRLDPRRRRFVFTGPQAQQLFTLTSQPLSLSLPAKALTAIGAVAVAGAVPAAQAGRGRLWLAACVLGLAGPIAVVAARVPVYRAPRGPLGWAQRAVTAALWLAWPLVRRR